MHQNYLLDNSHPADMTEEQWNSVVETNSLLHGSLILREAYHLPITVERAMYPGKSRLKYLGKAKQSQAKHKQPFDSNLVSSSTLPKMVPTQAAARTRTEKGGVTQ
jgi:hypothetical protein